MMEAPWPESTGAIDRLWNTFRQRLERYLRARLPGSADAEDVLQDIFLRIHETASRPGCDDCTGGWLYGVARRALADFYRARGRHVEAHAASLDEDTAPPSEGADPWGALSPYEGPHDVHEEVVSWLHPLIEELPEPYRVPLRMAEVEGKKQQDIADALGLSLSGAKSRVQRGRVLLGELLKRCCEVEFGPEGRAVAFRRLRPADDPCDDACR